MPMFKNSSCANLFLALQMLRLRYAHKIMYVLKEESHLFPTISVMLLKSPKFLKSLLQVLK